MQLEDLFYWPRQREVFYPWILGLLTCSVLGGFGIKPISIPSLPVIGSVSLYFVLFLFVTVMNGLLLYARTRTFYLTFHIAWRPLLGTLLSLSLLYPAAYGMLLVVSGEATITIFSQGGFDKLFTARWVIMGLAMLIPFLLASIFWRGAVREISTMRAMRSKALPILRKVYRGTPIDEDEKDQLYGALESLSGVNRTLNLHLQTQRDRTLFHQWRDAAIELHTQFQGYALADLRLFRTDEELCEQLQEQLRKMEKTYN